MVDDSGDMSLCWWPWGRCLWVSRCWRSR